MKCDDPLDESLQNFRPTQRPITNPPMNIEIEVTTNTIITVDDTIEVGDSVLVYVHVGFGSVIIPAIVNNMHKCSTFIIEIRTLQLQDYLALWSQETQDTMISDSELMIL